MKSRSTCRSAEEASGWLRIAGAEPPRKPLFQESMYGQIFSIQPVVVLVDCDSHLLLFFRGDSRRKDGL